MNWQKSSKILYLLYMDYLKLFGKTKAELNSLLTSTEELSKDISVHHRHKGRKND